MRLSEKYKSIKNDYKVFDRFDIEEKRLIQFSNDSKKVYFYSKIPKIDD